MAGRLSAWWGCSGWERFVRLGAVATFVVAVWTFGWIAHEVSDGDHAAWETAAIRLLRHGGQPIGPPGFVGVIRDVTALGSSVTIVTLTMLILGYLILRRRYRVAVLLAVATAGGQVVNIVLKNGFDRARPDERLRLVEVHSTSFPSGHAMAAAVFYLTTGAALARAVSRRREKIYVVSAAVFLTVAIGLSRVFLGAHYPSDVVAGWAAGTAWALVCGGVAAEWERHGRRCAGEKESSGA